MADALDCDKIMTDKAIPFRGIIGNKNDCSKCSIQLLCLPASIGVDDFDRLNSVVQKRRPLKRGDILFSSGQRLDSIYVAREGAFKTVVFNANGDSQVTGFHLPGEILGLDALGASLHTCDAIALTLADVCEIPLSDLELVASQVPGLQHQLLKIIGQTINRDHKHIELLSKKNAQERVAIFLHQLAERYRLLGRSELRFMIPMSREDIGSYLGLVIETVSRTLSKMQDEGLISVNGRDVQILNKDRLYGFAHESIVRKIA
jgi:CRP/FNR family transcriptional regulator, anaerobic regulatory protein